MAKGVPARLLGDIVVHQGETFHPREVEEPARVPQVFFEGPRQAASLSESGLQKEY